MGGQAYVTVQAGTASSYTTRTIVSGDMTLTGYVIKWTFANGITGHEWSDPVPVTPVEGNIEATNASISAAYTALPMDTQLLALLKLYQWGCAAQATL